MNTKKDGGAAFPASFETTNGYPRWHESVGMTLRDWFAGQALDGLLSSNATYGGKTDDRASLAADAYAYADAMIAEREK